MKTRHPSMGERINQLVNPDSAVTFRAKNNAKKHVGTVD
jgi:hypothetical protein